MSLASRLAAAVSRAGIVGAVAGGCHSMLLVLPERRIAVTVVVNDDAGEPLRRDVAWAELCRLTGLNRARLVPTGQTARAAVRGAVARLVAAGMPRTLSS